MYLRCFFFIGVRECSTFTSLSVCFLVVFREHFVFLNVKSAVPLRDTLNSLLTISENFITYFSYAKTPFSSTTHYIPNRAINPYLMAIFLTWEYSPSLITTK